MSDEIQDTITIEVKKKNLAIDASMLSTFMSCGRLFDFRYNHNLVSNSGKSNSLECGSLVHYIKEYYNKNRISGFARNISLAAGFTAGQEYYFGCSDCKKLEQNEGCAQHKNDPFKGCQNTPLDSEGYLIGYNYVIKTMEEYFLHYSNDSWVVLEAEVVKSKVLYEDDEIRVLWKAKIDEVVETPQGIFSLDTKTMKQNRRSMSNSNQFMGQCCIMGTNLVIIDKVGFQKTLPPKEKFVREIVPYSSGRLLEWQSVILPREAYKLINAYETGVWDPDFTNCENKYGYCQFYEHVCSGEPSMREENIRMHFVTGKVWDPSNE